MIWLFISEFISSVFYLKIFSGFFQQDEWFGFSEYVLRTGNTPVEWLQYFFAPSVVHYTPFTLATISAIFSVFGMNYEAFGALSLILHLVNIGLVYILAKELLGSKFLAGITSLLFGTFAAHYQATFWLIANIGTHFATIFGLVSVIYFVKYLKRGDTRKLYLSLVSIVVSIMFKEISLGILLLMIVSVWFFGDLARKKKIKTTKTVLLLGTLYVAFRLVMASFVLGTPESKIVNQLQPSSNIIYNIITIPMKAVSQTVVPAGQLRVIAEKVTLLFPEKATGIFGSPEFEVFMITKTLEVESLLLFVGFSVFLFFIIKKSKDRQFNKVILFSYIWILVNSFIFAFAPERSGVVFLVDSRNLYLVSVGTAMAIVVLISRLAKTKIKTILFVLPFLVLNMFWLWREMSVQIKMGETRRQILNKVTDSNPNLTDKVIFYTQSSQSYYGLPSDVRIMPFQSGFGQTLLAWYYPAEKYQKQFFQDRFLWEITDQGYKEVDGRGFGYFRDKELLFDAIREYNISLDSVIAYKWEGETESLSDISEEIRQDYLAR